MKIGGGALAAASTAAAAAATYQLAANPANDDTLAAVQFGELVAGAGLIHYGGTSSLPLGPSTALVCVGAGIIVGSVIGLTVGSIHKLNQPAGH